MANDFDNENGEEKEESFAAMLEAYSPGEEADIGVGDKVRGKIVAIGRESVFVDTGTTIQRSGFRPEQVVYPKKPA